MLEFTDDFLLPNLMGPNCVKIAAELLTHVPPLSILQGQRILDLGPGTGLTSMFFADYYKSQVFAADLWISPTENYRRFKEFGMEKQVFPIHAEANDLPFAEKYFDAVLSVDSYQYYGNTPHYLSRLAPLVRQGGIIAVAVPGLQDEFINDKVPEEMLPFWVDNMNFHSVGWWRELWEKSSLVEVLDAFEISCHADAWADWLRADNPYAKNDIAMMEAEGGKYFNTVGIIAQVK